MDAMYLNLMFINPRPPVGAGAKGARSTRPSLTPPPLQKILDSRLTRQWMASLGLRCGSCFISTLLDGILQARIQDFLRGGGREDVHKHTHTPLEHCPRDVIRPPENWKTPPLLDIHKHPPLGHCPYDVIHIPGGGGGWSVPVTHAHFVA